MRRPLTAFCFAEAFGILAAYYGFIDYRHLCLLGAGVFIVQKYRAALLRSAFPLAMLAFFACGYLGMSHHMDTEDGLCAWDGRVAHLSGIVQKVEIKEHALALTLRVDRCGPPGGPYEPLRSKTLVQLDAKGTSEDRSAAYDMAGRRISFEGRMSLPSGRRNPGGFDYALYLRSKGIRTLCRVSRYRLDAGEVRRPVMHVLAVQKGRFLDLAAARMDPDRFSLMAGLLFGEKSAMADDISEAFRYSGMSHLFAVSGLHVGLLYGVVLTCVKRRSRSAAYGIASACIIAYAALANFSVSVLRAAGMAGLSMLAVLFRRRYDLTSAASAVSVLLMTANPFHVFDAGFQLSFLAVYSMGVALPFVDLKIRELADRRKKEWIRKAGSVLAPCAVVQAGMAPLTAFHFLMFSPVGLLVNPPALFLAGLMLPSGLLLFLISVFSDIVTVRTGAETAVFEGLFAAIAGTVDALASLLLALSAPGRLYAEAGLCPAPPIGLVAVFYAGFFFYFSEMRHILIRRKKHAALAAVTAAGLLSAAVLPYAAGLSDSPLPWKYDAPPVVFLDVGQGDCIHIRSGAYNILVDGGGHYYTDVGRAILEPYLLKHGITRIDLAFVTHADLDHKKGVEELSARMPVDVLAVPEPYRSDPDRFVAIRRSRTVYLSAGQTVALGEDASFRVLWPDASVTDSAGENSKSLVLLLSVEGVDILLTGDVERAEEMRMTAGYRCDILKVAHHGSNGSTGPEFVARAAPAYAVISCGRSNAYGHPAPRVVELLENSGIMVGRTDLHGALCLRSAAVDSYVLENARREVRWIIRKKEAQ